MNNDIIVQDDFAQIGAMFDMSPEEIDVARQQAQQAGLTAQQYARQVGPALISQSGLPVEQMNATFAKLQQVLSPERQAQVESDYQRQTGVADLAGIAGRIGASFDPTGKAQQQVAATTQQHLAQAKDATIGKQEREVKAAKDTAAIAKEQLDSALKLEKHGMDKQAHQTAQTKSNLDIKRLEMDIKDITQRQDANSELSVAARDAILATDEGKQLAARLGDKFATLNYDQAERTFSNIKELVSLNVQKQQLAIAKSQSGRAAEQHSWARADRQQQQDANSEANVAFRNMLKQAGVNVPDRYTIAIDKAGSNLAERLIQTTKPTAATQKKIDEAAQSDVRLNQLDYDLQEMEDTMNKLDAKFGGTGWAARLGGSAFRELTQQDADYNRYMQLHKKLATSARQEMMSGSTSDKDIALLLSTVPTPKQGIDTFTAWANGVRAKNNVARKHNASILGTEQPAQQPTNAGPTPAQAREELRRRGLL